MLLFLLVAWRGFRRDTKVGCKSASWELRHRTPGGRGLVEERVADWRARKTNPDTAAADERYWPDQESKTWRIQCLSGNRGMRKSLLGLSRSASGGFNPSGWLPVPFRNAAKCAGEYVPTVFRAGGGGDGEGRR